MQRCGTWLLKIDTDRIVDVNRKARVLVVQIPPRRRSAITADELDGTADILDPAIVVAQVEKGYEHLVDQYDWRDLAIPGGETTVTCRKCGATVTSR